MSKQITIANVTTSLIEYKGSPVCTTAQLSEFYGCDSDRIQDNHRKNADRFEEGKHFIKLEGIALRRFKETLTGNNPVSPNTRNLILWTEKGAARHAKMLSTDKAWEVFEQLEDAYFRVATVAQQPAVRDPRTAALIESLVRMDAIEQEQERQATELASVQESVAVIEARTNPENKHFTVAGYANLIGRKIELGAAARLGKKCAVLSKEQGLPIGDVKDPRFGYVHSYHETVLQAVFDSAGGCQ